MCESVQENVSRTDPAVAEMASLPQGVVSHNKRLHAALDFRQCFPLP